MTMEKSGLSRMERSILQDEGITGVGQENNYFKMWKWRIKNKTRFSINDCLLLLKHRNWVELDEFVKENCKNDLLEIHSLIAEILNLDSETSIGITDKE